MKTKLTIIQAFGILLSVLLASCGDPVQKFKVEVVDEANAPMRGVEVVAWFNRRGKTSPLDSYKVFGTTDAKGMVEIKGETVWYQTSVSAQPEVYYKSMKFDHWTQKRSGNHWEPWPVEVKLVMKKIGNPHPMYAARTKDIPWFRFPDRDKLGPVGFDLERRDWVEPYGKGKVADLIISGTLKDPSDTGYREDNGRMITTMAKGTIRVTFSNPDDGIQKFEDSGGSKLAGPAVASLEGYAASWDFPNYGASPHECYVFRVRSVRDDKGKIVSARYGKIDGGLLGWFTLRSSVDFVYYLNAVENERGLEWDGKTNLFSGLGPDKWPERF